MSDTAKKAVKRTHTVGTRAETEPTVVSDDELGMDSESEFTLYNALEAALSQDVEIKPVALEIPNRPDVALVFMPELDFDVYNAWVKRSTDRKSSEINYMRLAMMAISNLNTGIRMNGRDVFDPDGEPRTVKSPSIHKTLGIAVGGTSAAIKKLYGNDGHVIQATKILIEKCGYSLEGDVLEADSEGPLDH